MLAVEVFSHENGVAARKRVDEIIEMDRNKEPRSETISRDQKKITLVRLDRSADTCKIMKRSININEDKIDRIAKADGVASVSPLIEFISADDGEAVERGVDTGAKPHFAG